MFTIIRIMLSNPTVRHNKRNQAPIADNNSEDSKSNPWKNELDRLAQRNPIPIAASYAVKRKYVPAPAPAPQPATSQAKSDLSVWWGRSLSARTVSGPDQPLRKVPPKKQSRWQQL